MKVYSGLDNFSCAKSVVTVGMFDGVHRGHQSLLNTLIETAKLHNADPVVVTLWPHPRIFLNQDPDILRFLTSLEEKTEMFSTTGVKHLILLPFNEQLASFTAKQFIQQILIDKLSACHLIMGFNHKFGKPIPGEKVDFQQLASELNIGLSVAQPLLIDGQKISSTYIRNLLSNGEIEKANDFLGYRFLVSGRVVGGKQLGRTIGFPTANVVVEDTAKMIPEIGVYACKVHVMGKTFGGMLNIGYRPTIDTHKDFKTIEVHIFDFKEDIYSEEIKIEFIAKTRDERKFQNVQALQLQLKSDEQQIRQLLVSLPQ